jgi:hypothetical protein
LVSTFAANGEAATLATVTPSTWNSTWLTPTLSVALAVICSVPVSPSASAAGAVNATVGGCVSALDGLIVTDTAALVVAMPQLSVARAVRLCMPVLVGVQLIEWGAAVSSPILVLPSKNSTRAIVPSLSFAVALTVSGVPTLPVPPPAGALNATLGALPAGPVSVNSAV